MPGDLLEVRYTVTQAGMQHGSMHSLLEQQNSIEQAIYGVAL